MEGEPPRQPDPERTGQRQPTSDSPPPQRLVATVESTVRADWHWWAPIIVAIISAAYFWALPDASVLVKDLTLTICMLAGAAITWTCPYIRSRPLAVMLAFLFLLPTPLAWRKVTESYEQRMRVEDAFHGVSVAITYESSTHQFYLTNDRDNVNATYWGCQFDSLPKEVEARPVLLHPHRGYHIPALPIEQYFRNIVSEMHDARIPIFLYLTNDLGEKFQSNTLLWARLNHGKLINETQTSAIEKADW